MDSDAKDALSCYQGSEVVGSGQPILWPQEPGHGVYVSTYAMVDGYETQLYHDQGLALDVVPVKFGDSEQGERLIILESGLWILVTRSKAGYPRGYIEGCIERARADGRVNRREEPQDDPAVALMRDLLERIRKDFDMWCDRSPSERVTAEERARRRELFDRARALGMVAYRDGGDPWPDEDRDD